jgi:hypothetical protein
VYIGLAFPTFFLFASLFLIFVAGKRPNIQRPNWNSNPFNFSHGEQFFYLAAFVILASGVMACIRSLIIFGEVFPLTAAPVALALSIWASLQLLASISKGESQHVA